MALRLLILVALLLPSVSYCIPEEDIPESYDSLVWAFYEKHTEARQFSSHDGRNIYYYLVNQDDKSAEKAYVFVSPGRTESSFKYAELVYDLYQEGFSLILIDHRGQGKSNRLSANFGVSYVDTFEDYVKDLEVLFLQELKLDDKPKFVWAHSMGAHIVSRFILKHPTYFDRLVLSSPMFDMKTAPLPELFAYWLFRVPSLLGFGENYFFGQTEYIPGEVYRGTSSTIRYEAMIKKRNQYPKEWIGGVSFHWLAESIVSCEYILERAHELTQPILMLQGGSDGVVDLEGQTYVCQKAKNCDLKVFPKAAHEILNEVDVIRKPAYDAVLSFFNEHWQAG